jgi:lysyl-tRNA synthetase class 2
MADDLREVRIQKLEALRQAGVRPYADRFERTHTLAEAYAAAKAGEGTRVRTAGRVVSARAFGNLTFAHLQDGTGRCQVGLDASKVGKEALERFDRLVDLGDFVGVEGTTFRTKKGEPSIRAESWTFLSKAILPLPEKWHGLSDVETRQRERHLDLLSNPETRERFRTRTRVVTAIRAFFDRHGFEEVDTPVLWPKASGALARPFLTHHNALDLPCALRIAPETWLKRCVAGGIDRVYEIARCFRNEGMDPSHLQDFTMLEAYGAYWDYRDNMAFVEEMLLDVVDRVLGTRRIPWGEGIDLSPPWPRRTMRELVLEDGGIDIDEHRDAASLRRAIEARGLRLERDDLAALGRGPLIDLLYKKVTRPKLVRPVFVTGHPIELSPLARRNDDAPGTTDRYQLVVNGWEIVNAYSELVDPLDQRRRFEEQAAARAAGDAEAMEPDEDYLRCMEHGMPPMSGLGMGVDRLVCLLTGQQNLREAVLFPLMRPLDAPAEPAAPTAPPAPGMAPDVDRWRDEGGALASGPPIASATPYPTEVKPEFQDLLGQPVDDVPDLGVTPERARALFDEWVKTPSLRRQMTMASAVMAALARRLGRNEAAWRGIGLLHNLDYDRVKEPERHCLVAAEVLKAEGMHPGAIHAIAAHNDEGLAHTGVRCVSLLDHALSASEAVVGLIHATSQVLPSKRLADVQPSSVMKRHADPKFAATVDRRLIARSEKTGLTLGDFVALAVEAVRDLDGAGTDKRPG